jgi:RHS repeat-associated protein
MLGRLKHAMMLMAIVLSIASPALAHTPPPSFASELNLRHIDLLEESEISEALPIVPASTFEDVARIELPPPSIAETLEQRTDAMLEHAEAGTHRLFASDSAELASWPLASDDENNINGERKLSLELHRATEFQALPFAEPATGLVYARARWYDPSTGSFLTPDPLGIATRRISMPSQAVTPST